MTPLLADQARLATRLSDSPKDVLARSRVYRSGHYINLYGPDFETCQAATRARDLKPSLPITCC